MYKPTGTVGRAKCFAQMKTLISALYLIAAAGSAVAQTAPQTVPDAQHRQGETLTDRLDRTDGVIKPPPVDAPMPIEPPKTTSNMPVLKPGDTPQQQTSPSAGK
jgi:hypothetical protein